MRGDPSFLPRSPCRPLLLLLFQLQLIRTFVFAQLKCPLVGTQPAICGTDEGFKRVIWAIVQRDGEGRQVERCDGLLRVLPE